MTVRALSSQFQMVPRVLRLTYLVACGYAIVYPLLAQDKTLGLIDAVGYALAHQPSLVAQKAQIDIQRGVKLQVSGNFDTVIQGNASQGLQNGAATLQFANGLFPLPSAQTVDSSNLGVAATRLFRDGIGVSAGFSLQRTTDSYLYPDGLNYSNAGVTVTLPLLRGRGKKVVDAQEVAAEQEVSATELDLAFLVDQTVLNTASDYWGYVAGIKNLEVAVESEDRGKIYVQNTQALLEADHVAKNDLNEVDANLAARAATRIAAEQAVVTARQQLASDMGMSGPEMLVRLPNAGDPFPEPKSVPSEPVESQLRQQFENALKLRPDYQAAENRKAQATILFAAAKNRLLPVLNIQASAGYQGIKSGSNIQELFGSPFGGLHGPNASGGLNYTFPPSNETSKGAVLQAAGVVRQADVTLLNSGRSISQQLIVARNAVRNATLQVRKTEESVMFSSSALDGAKEKYRSGIGSIVEILQVEDELNVATSNLVQAHLSFALALLQLRFASGTLVNHGPPVDSVTPDLLTTLPE